MTDMTAEQAIKNLLRKLWKARHVHPTAHEISLMINLAHIAGQALSAPRVPDGWRSLIERLLASDGGDGRYNASEFLAARDELKALLTAAQSPAEPTIAETFERIGRDIKMDDAKIMAMVDARYDDAEPAQDAVAAIGKERAARLREGGA